MLYRRNEGDIVRQGFNWGRDKASTFQLIVKFWRVLIYFRIRSPWIMEGNKGQVNFKKYLFDIDWITKTRWGSVEYEFATHTVKVRDKRVSMELLEDIIEREGTSCG